MSGEKWSDDKHDLVVAAITRPYTSAADSLDAAVHTSMENIALVCAR